MIKLDNVTKIYMNKDQPQVLALKDINLSLPDKGLVFILGKSGCGKSTLLNLIGGLDSFNEGDIVVNGKSMKDFSNKDYDAYRNMHIGFVFQDYNLIDNLTVEDNIKLALELQGQRVNRDRIYKILEEVEMQDYMTRYVRELSGGQRQRVAISRAMIKESIVLLADEPSGNLDFKTSEMIYDILSKCAKDRLVIVVTHDKKTAEKYGDRIIEFKNGEIISDTDKISDCVSLNINDNLKANDISFFSIIKMSLNNLKSKKFVLCITLLLFSLSICMSGVFLSITFFDRDEATLMSLIDQGMNDITISLEPLPDIPPTNNTYMSHHQVDLIRKDMGDYEFDVIYKSNNLSSDSYKNYNDVDEYYDFRSGLMELNESISEKYDFQLLSGRYPSSFNEIVIPLYIYSGFNQYGFRYKEVSKDINSYEDLIGLPIMLSNYHNLEVTIVGILDTGYSSRYINTQPDIYFSSKLRRELYDYLPYSCHSALFGNSDLIKYLYYDNYYIHYCINEDINSVGFELKDSNMIKKDGVTQLENNHIVIDKQVLKEVIIDKFEEYTSAENITDNIIEELINNGIYIRINLDNNSIRNYNEFNLKEFLIVGYYECNDELYYRNVAYFNSAVINEYFEKDHIIRSIVTKLSDKKSSDIRLINYTFREDIDENYKYGLKHYNSSYINRANDLLTYGSKTLLWISIIMGVFAVSMIMNYISMTIEHKAKEIGILRSLGARRIDVFKIFYFESLILVLLSFFISLPIAYMFLYYLALDIGLRIFHLGFMQILIMILISVVISTLSSMIPILKMTHKKPVEIIRKS